MKVRVQEVIGVTAIREMQKRLQGAEALVLPLSDCKALTCRSKPQLTVASGKHTHMPSSVPTMFLWYPAGPVGMAPSSELAPPSSALTPSHAGIFHPKTGDQENTQPRFCVLLFNPELGSQKVPSRRGFSTTPDLIFTLPGFSSHSSCLTHLTFQSSSPKTNNSLLSLYLKLCLWHQPTIAHDESFKLFPNCYSELFLQQWREAN